MNVYNCKYNCCYDCKYNCCYDYYLRLYDCDYHQRYNKFY